MIDPPTLTLHPEVPVQIGKPQRIIEVTPDERDRPSPAKPGDVERDEKRQADERRRKERAPADPAERA